MERFCVLVLYFSFAFSPTVLAIPTDDVFYSRKLKFEIHGHGLGRSSTYESSLKKLKLQIQKRFISKPQLKFLTTVDQPNAVTVNSPFSLPPFDSLAPTPLPINSPPFCEDSPPQTPRSSSSSAPPPPPGMIYSHTPPPPLSGMIYSHTPPPPLSGMIYSHTPPPPLSGMIYSHAPPPPPPSPQSPPGFQPSVPSRSQSPPPGSPSIFPIAPIGPLAPCPPANISSPSSPIGPPSPPHHYGPSPPKHGYGPPSPTVFLPPMVYPPPAGPPPAGGHGGKPGSSGAAWCVAKPTVPDPIIQVAMDYACGSGADCKSIQPNGHCYEPNTVLAHASYAFNSYWQNNKVSGGTCDFGGTAMIVTVDPSSEGCKFILG